MPAKSTANDIALELDIARAFARAAEIAFSAGNTTKADEAIRDAWTAWEHAAGEVLKHDVETLHPRLLELEVLLRGLEGRPLTKAARAG